MMTTRIQPLSLPHGASVLLGVSLGNRAFGGGFARRLAQWARERQFGHLHVMLFDACEVTNYQVFRGLSYAEAARRAAQRAQEMGTMFGRACSEQRGLRFTVRTQSEIERWLPGFDACHRLLVRAYEEQRRFTADVDKQVRHNLSAKIESGRGQIVEARVKALAAYVLRELAWFYCYYKDARRDIIEVYPGEEMQVKARLLEGWYEDETGLKAVWPRPRFKDISFLLEGDDRVEKTAAIA